MHESQSNLFWACAQQQQYSLANISIHEGSNKQNIKSYTMSVHNYSLVLLFPSNINLAKYYIFSKKYT